MPKTIDLLQGTLEILILKAVSLGPLHGYGILLRIQQISGNRLSLAQPLVCGSTKHLYCLDRSEWHSLRNRHFKSDQRNRDLNTGSGFSSECDTPPDAGPCALGRRH
jgi:hypothetical protein